MNTITMAANDVRYCVINGLRTLHTVLIPIAQRLVQVVREEVSQSKLVTDPTGQQMPASFSRLSMADMATRDTMNSIVVLLKQAKNSDQVFMNALRCYSERGEANDFRQMDKYQLHAIEVELGQRAVDTEKMLKVLEPNVPYGSLRFPEW